MNNMLEKRQLSKISIGTLSIDGFDKHTHFHIIPRYKEPREFAGMTWVDDFVPDPLVQQREQVSQNALDKIKKKIGENIKNR